MIAKLIKARGFRRILEYSLRESKGYLLDTNMGENSPRGLSREFNQVRNVRPEIKRPVHFVSIALSPKESLTDEQWREVAQKYLSGMGFTDNQFAVAKHTDAAHPHIHIIVNRVTLGGKLVSDSKDYYRQEQIMRKLEQEYDLTPVMPSKEIRRRAPTKGELEQAVRIGTPSAKMLLQKLVDKALQENPEYSGFIARLEVTGAIAIPNKAATGRISGISFQYEGVTMKGSDLGRGYTWAGLQKRGLHYGQIRNDGKDERREYTPKGGHPTRDAARTANSGIAEFNNGSVDAGSGATFSGHFLAGHDNQTADGRGDDAMPKSGRKVHYLSPQNGRALDTNAGSSGDSGKSHTAGNDRGTGGQQGGLAGITRPARTSAKNPTPDRRQAGGATR